MINISDSARDRLLHIMQQEKEDKNFVRVGVESGGCSGLSYKLDFDNAKNDDDELMSMIKKHILTEHKEIELNSENIANIKSIIKED